MSILFALVLFTFAIVILIWGDKEVGHDKGKVIRIASLSTTQTKLVKWVGALFAFWLGIAMLFIT